MSLLVLLLLGCSATGGDEEPLGPVYGLTGVPIEYYPAFDSLRASVEAHEDATARLILERLVVRMEGDREDYWDEMSRDERRGLESGLSIAEGFGRILAGRERIAALSLSLLIGGAEPEAAGASPAEGELLQLAIRSGWEGDLELRPGPATLHETLVWVSPLGQEGSVTRTVPVELPERIDVDGGGERTLALTRRPLGLPAGALAAQVSWSLQIRSGGLRDREGRYPGMGWAVEPLEYIAIAAWLPNGPVDPEELVDYLSERDLTQHDPARVLPAILERTVRIPAERHGEALELLAPLVERSPPERVALIVPSLRWLSRRAAPGSDPLAWRLWMRNYGGLDAGARGAGDPGGTSSSIDLPAGR